MKISQTTVGTNNKTHAYKQFSVYQFCL
jgi:hypothetical protein